MKLGHIVIMGGGFSGSLAALACAHLATKITVIERYPDFDGEARTGTPQSHHVHIFSKSGQTLLDRLVPGILAELQGNGAIEADWGQDTLWHGPSGPYARYESGIKSLLFSRKLLDRVMWKRVRAAVPVEIVAASVVGLDFAKGAVVGVRLSDGTRIGADLYIEARGRSSSIRELLEEVVGPIPVRSIPNRLRYTTAVFDAPPAKVGEPRQYYRQASGDNPLGYYVSPIENDRVIFTAVDYHGKTARPLAVLRDHPVLRGRDDAPTRSFAKLHNVHTRFGRAKTWPRNFVVIGDAICRLNPVYGHGLTMCTEQVASLVSALGRGERFSARALQKRLDATVAPRWLFVAIDEMRAAERPGLFYSLCHRYFDWIARAAMSDQAVHRLTLEVLHGLRSPLALLSPSLCARVLTASMPARAPVVAS